MTKNLENQIEAPKAQIEVMEVYLIKERKREVKDLILQAADLQKAIEEVKRLRREDPIAKTLEIAEIQEIEEGEETEKEVQEIEIEEEKEVTLQNLHRQTMGIQVMVNLVQASSTFAVTQIYQISSFKSCQPISGPVQLFTYNITTLSIYYQNLFPNPAN